MKHGKKYRASAAKYDLTKKYNVSTACGMVQDMKVAKFDETVEAHFVLRNPRPYVIRLCFQINLRARKKFWCSARMIA